MIYERGSLQGECLGDHGIFSADIIWYLSSIDVNCRLEHAITGEEIEGWKRTSELETAVEVELGDYVVHNDWVGQVCIYIFQSNCINPSQDRRGIASLALGLVHTLLTPSQALR